MKICTILPMLTVMLVTASSAAVGADLTLFVGGQGGGSLKVDLAADPVGTIRDLSGGAVLGVRLNTGLLPLLGLEHTIGFSSDFLFPDGGPFNSSAHGFIYSTNLVLGVPVGKVVPYLTGGLGFVHQTGDLPGDVKVGTRFAANFGGGVKFTRLFGPAGLRFDVRGYNAQSPSWSSSRINFVEASGGIVFSF